MRAAAALAAKSAGNTVTLHVTPDATGYRHLEYTDVR